MQNTYDWSPTIYCCFRSVCLPCTQTANCRVLNTIWSLNRPVAYLPIAATKKTHKFTTTQQCSFCIKPSVCLLRFTGQQLVLVIGFYFRQPPSLVLSRRQATKHFSGFCVGVSFERWKPNTTKRYTSWSCSTLLNVENRVASVKPQINFVYSWQLSYRLRHQQFCPGEKCQAKSVDVKSLKEMTLSGMAFSSCWHYLILCKLNMHDNVNAVLPPCHVLHFNEKSCYVQIYNLMSVYL